MKKKNENGSNGDGNVVVLSGDIYNRFVDNSTDVFLNEVVERDSGKSEQQGFDVDKWVAKAEQSWKSLEQAFADGDLEAHYSFNQKARRFCLKLFDGDRAKIYSERLRADVMKRCIASKLARTGRALNNVRGELSRANEDYQRYKLEINDLKLQELRSADAADSVSKAIDAGRSTLEDIAKEKSSAFRRHDTKSAQKLMEQYLLFEREVDSWDRKKQAALINADICDKKRDIVEDHLSMVSSYKELLSSAEIMTSLLREHINLALEMYDRFGNPDKIKAGLSLLEETRATREKIRELYDGILAKNTKDKINHHEMFSSKDRDSARQLIDDCEKDKKRLYHKVIERRNELLTHC